MEERSDNSKRSRRCCLPLLCCADEATSPVPQGESDSNRLSPVEDSQRKKDIYAVDDIEDITDPCSSKAESDQFIQFVETRPSRSPDRKTSSVPTLPPIHQDQLHSEKSLEKEGPVIDEEIKKVVKSKKASGKSKARPRERDGLELGARPAIMAHKKESTQTETESKAEPEQPPKEREAPQASPEAQIGTSAKPKREPSVSSFSDSRSDVQLKEQPREESPKESPKETPTDVYKPDKDDTSPESDDKKAVASIEDGDKMKDKQKETSLVPHPSFAPHPPTKPKDSTYRRRPLPKLPGIASKSAQQADKINHDMKQKSAKSPEEIIIGPQELPPLPSDLPGYSQQAPQKKEHRKNYHGTKSISVSDMFPEFLKSSEGSDDFSLDSEVTVTKVNKQDPLDVFQNRLTSTQQQSTSDLNDVKPKEQEAVTKMKRKSRRVVSEDSSSSEDTISEIGQKPKTKKKLKSQEKKNEEPRPLAKPIDPYKIWNLPKRRSPFKFENDSDTAESFDQPAIALPHNGDTRVKAVRFSDQTYVCIFSPDPSSGDTSPDESWDQLMEEETVEASCKGTRPGMSISDNCCKEFDPDLSVGCPSPPGACSSLDFADDVGYLRQDEGEVSNAAFNQEQQMSPGSFAGQSTSPKKVVPLSQGPFGRPLPPKIDLLAPNPFPRRGNYLPPVRGPPLPQAPAAVLPEATISSSRSEPYVSRRSATLSKTGPLGVAVSAPQMSVHVTEPWMQERNHQNSSQSPQLLGRKKMAGRKLRKLDSPR